MIDIVFQLLTFFIMTLKIVTPEGDFNITMPAGGSAPQDTIDDVKLPIRIKLTANDDGDLAKISRLPDGGGPAETIESFDELHEMIKAEVKDEGGPGSEGAKELEVELDCDYGLKYKYTMAAITAVSGIKQGDDVIKLVEKIKFTPPK